MAATAIAATGLDAPIVVTLMPAPKAATGERPAPTLVPEIDLAGARLVIVMPDGKARALSSGFESACDPAVSFDGKTVLFAGRQSATAPWRIWEIGADGAGLRAITPESIDARHPVYVSTLFTLDSPKPWETLVFVGHDRSSAVTHLYNIKLDGTELRRLSYNPNGSSDPAQLWDGKMIYTSVRQPMEPAASPVRLGLFAIHIEGADNELYGGELGGPIQRTPCPTASGAVVFVETDTAAPDGAGRLAWIEQRRPHVTYHAPRPGDAHRYRYPSPWRNNEILVAQRDAGTKARWGIVRYEVGSGVTNPVFSARDADAVQAVALREHAMPDGHSTVVTTNDNHGTLYGLDCYTTNAARTGKLAPGEVKRVRIIEGTPGLARRLVGEADVERDGSFNLFVPCDTPLQVQTVDENGLSLGTCDWIWLKPAEKRGCIGCHEDPERVPENNFVLALHHDSVPVLTPVAERRMVTFARDIVPILQKGGIEVLDANGKALPLALATPDGMAAAYRLLTQGAAPIVEAGRARTSRLVWQLAGRNTSRPWDAAAASRVSFPSPAPLAPDDLRTVILWIDLGAAYDDTTPATGGKENAS